MINQKKLNICLNQYLVYCFYNNKISLTETYNVIEYAIQIIESLIDRFFLKIIEMRILVVFDQKYVTKIVFFKNN
jgi:hypothetical protein